MATRPELSYCADLVRRHDRDRFLTALFAPTAQREDLFALYAFNLEVARIRERVREPMMGLIRLQWWREAIDDIYAGGVRRHEVVRPLAEAAVRHGLSRRHFDRLLDTREKDMADIPPTSLPALIDYAEGSSESLVLLALESLSRGESGRSAAAVAAGRGVGVAWALVGLLRAVPFHARAGRLYLPQDLLERAGVRHRDVLEFRPSAGLAAVVREVARAADARLGEARRRRGRIPRHLLPALLPAVLADLYLGRLERSGYNVFDRVVQDAPPGRVWRLAARTAQGRY